jgi:plastocyanin
MNKKTTIWVVVLLVVVAAVGAGVYAATKSSNTATTTHDDGHNHGTSGSNGDTSSTASASATITATDDGFNPNTVTVKKGQTVKVVNSSSSSIEFSSGSHPTHLEDPEINMGTLKPGESGTITPTKTGTHSFHDHLHDDHTGTLIVTE